MTLKTKLRHSKNRVFSVLPYLFLIKNKYQFLISLILRSSRYKVVLKDGTTLNFRSSQFNILLNLLGIICFSTSYSKKTEDLIEITFDMQNKFIIPLKNTTKEDQNLLELLFHATKFGANLITESGVNLKDFRDKTFRIIEKDNKKIIETSEGIRFFVDSINTGNTIVETFVNKIHLINSHDDWNDKIVIDVGAECGDTPLYYASLGAKVFAIEPIKEHFDAMIRNLSLNPDLSKNITPINAAIGKDEILKFHQSTKSEISGGASFVYDLLDENQKIVKVKGYSLESLLKKYEISEVDLLKMDCKGCEFFLNEKVLEKVKRIKIEYVAMDSSHKLKDLLNTLEKMKFKYMIYRIDPFNHTSNKIIGHIYAKKTK